MSVLLVFLHIVLYFVVFDQIAAVVASDFLDVEVIVVLRMGLETLHESISDILDLAPDFQYDVFLTLDFNQHSIDVLILILITMLE